MIKIQDQIVPTKGVGKYFEIQALNFPMNPASVSFYWQVFNEETIQNGEETVTGRGVCILDGNLSMTAEEYTLWGTDDAYVIDWALEKLGFVEIA
jgi:hypothetical protein